MIYYIYIFIYTNLPVSDIVRLSHPRRRDFQTRKRFYHTLLTSKPATMTQSAQITILPYQP